jgi:hypothetical protein
VRHLAPVRLLIAALLTSAGLVLGLAGPALAAPAGVQPALVLVNQPVSKVCVGRTFRLGVWFQRYSGGSRAYRVAVYNPRGTRILYRHGQAPRGHWRFWKIPARMAGVYRSVYYGHWRSRTAWNIYRARTTARHC